MCSSVWACALLSCFFVFFKQKTAYEMRISDWSSDVCSSDLCGLETDNQTPIVPIFGRLVGMELEFRCARGCFGKKTPDDLAILGGVLISAEGLRRMIVQGKAGLDGKTFIETFSAVDAVEAKMAEVLASVRLACHEIATQS